MVALTLLFCVLVDLRDDRWFKVGVIASHNVLGVNWL